MKVIFFLFTLNLTIHAFTISPSASTKNLNKIQPSRFNTLLYAEDGESESDAEVKSTGNEDGNGANDILNSPAFLKRKLEVLQSDVKSIDEKISDANKIYEENKAEWGPQLDDLRKEVSNQSHSFTSAFSADIII